MSWAETTYIIEHFYNVFNINERMNTVENKFPIIATKTSNNLPANVVVEDLTEGTIWLVENDNGGINEIGILTDGTFVIKPINIESGEIDVSSLVDDFTSIGIEASDLETFLKELVTLLDESLQSYSTVFQIIEDGETLFSSFNTGYTTTVDSPKEIYLISTFYEITSDGTTETLTIK